MELNSHFRGLLGNIEPDPDAVATAKRSHEELRALLQSDDEISEADPDSYLSGSYARDTAINDIKDVDIIQLVDLDHTATSPDVAVAWLQGILQKHYSTVRAQGRSVQVTTDYGFQLDVVLSVAISHREGPIWIPDRDAKEWVASHPKGQISFGSHRNAMTDGYYKHLVKIVKCWRDRLPSAQAQVKSYILESLVAECVLFKPASYARGIVQIFGSILTSYTAYLVSELVPRIADPGYPSVNVAKRWKFKEFSAFMDNVRTSNDTAAPALAADDKQKSIALWRKLFGPRFRPRD